MRIRIAEDPKSRMNRATAPLSAAPVVTLQVACHAGGRGFESRRSRPLHRGLRDSLVAGPPVGRRDFAPHPAADPGGAAHPPVSAVVARLPPPRRSLGRRGTAEPAAAGRVPPVEERDEQEQVDGVPAAWP